MNDIPNKPERGGGPGVPGSGWAGVAIIGAGESRGFAVEPMRMDTKTKKDNTDGAIEPKLAYWDGEVPKAEYQLVAVAVNLALVLVL